MDPAELAAHMATVATELLSEQSESLTVRSVVMRAVELIPGAESASISVRTRRGRHQTLDATDDLALQADQLQQSLGEGPCLDSLQQADWFRSRCVRVDPRWPVWGPKAAELGVSSILSVLAFSGSEPRGALNLYSRREAAFDDRDDFDMALVYAIHASNALSAARLVDGLRVAVGSRHLIGVAQGIVMERLGLTSSQAFSLLQRVSSTTNTKLHEVARNIVETREVPTSTSPRQRVTKDLLET